MRTGRLRAPHPASIVAVLLLTATMAVSHGFDFRERVPARMTFDRFPTTLGDWSGVRIQLDSATVKELDLSTYLFADYMDHSGQVVNCYAAYYESQRKGESIHSPSTCMVGDGWVFTETGGAIIAMAEGGGAIQVNRALMQKDDSRQIAYYWFPMRGRILTSVTQMKLYNFWDGLTKHRTDGALVRLVTPVYENEPPEQAEKRLQAFAQQAIPVLNDFLPGD